MARVDREFFTEEDIKKNRIEDVLESDEEVLVSLTPDKRDYILEAIFKSLPIVLIWLAFDVFFIIMMIKTNAFENTMVIWFTIFFFAFHLLPVWLYFANIFKRVAGYKNIQYYFTDRRIIIRNGIIGIDYKIFYYQDINTVTVKVGLWDRMFKVGDLYINSVNQSAVLEDIKKPYFYLSKIQQIIQDIKTDISYPNDLRPKENHGYKTKYNPEDK